MLDLRTGGLLGTVSSHLYRAAEGAESGDTKSFAAGHEANECIHPGLGVCVPWRILPGSFFSTFL